MKLAFQLPFIAVLLCSGLGILSVACDPQTTAEKEPGSHAIAEEVVSGEMAWPVALDAGRKWQMDEHTRNSIARMKQLVAGDETDTLGKSLAGEFLDLMKVCTMQGPAHDQLHVFLNELMPRILALPDDGNDKKFKAEKEKIQNLLQEFGQYFE